MNAPGETRNSETPQQGGETALLLVDDDPNMGLLLGEALDKSRYRLPAEPLLAILAALTLAGGRYTDPRRRERRAREV